MKRNVLIIGGSSGIGKAAIAEFAKAGYNILTTINSSMSDKLATICSKYGADLKIFKLNVRDHDEIKKVIKEIFDYAKNVECVVYCPGVSKSEKLLVDEQEEDIEEIIDVNLKGAIYCSQECLKYLMKSKFGSIIFISSIYGLYGGACESVYSATKGGLVALTKSLALECANFNVRVNCLSPGFIESKMTERFTNDEKKEIIEKTPLGRLGQPEDVAKAILFLASGDSGFITGENITISGGVLRF